MDRRKFLAISALGVATAAVDPMVPAAQAKGFKPSRKEKAAGEYSIVILGDTHFDTEPASVYHSDYNEPVEWLNRVQRAEWKRNGEMWREKCPRIVKRAAELVDQNTRMAFQMGDLIQGDCGNPEVHKKMLDDTLNYFKGNLGGLPFVTDWRRCVSSHVVQPSMENFAKEAAMMTALLLRMRPRSLTNTAQVSKDRPSAPPMPVSHSYAHGVSDLAEKGRRIVFDVEKARNLADEYQRIQDSCTQLCDRALG